MEGVREKLSHPFHWLNFLLTTPFPFFALQLINFLGSQNDDGLIAAIMGMTLILKITIKEQLIEQLFYNAKNVGQFFVGEQVFLRARVGIKRGPKEQLQDQTKKEQFDVIHYSKISSKTVN